MKSFEDTRAIERVLRDSLARSHPGDAPEILQDSLTGVHNRRGFEVLAWRHLQAAQRKGGTLLVLSVTVRDLDTIGTAFGLEAANRAVCEIAKLLLSSVRRTDLIARMGDDEFLVLAVDAAEPSAPILRQRLEKRVGLLNQAPGRQFPLNLQVDIWLLAAEQGFSVEKLLGPASGVEGVPVLAASAPAEQVSSPYACQTEATKQKRRG